MKRVLVTGAGGFIGRQTLVPLQSAGYEIHAASLTIPDGAPDGICWYSHDLLNPDELSALFEVVRPTHLLHLAWYAAPGKFWNAPENRLWVDSGKLMMDAFVRNGGYRAVFAGTCAEYETGHGQCVEDRTPVRPATLYGVCKDEFHQFISAETRVSAVWGRIFHLYGVHEYPQRFVPAVIRSLLQGEEARCTAGTQIRDFMDVRDVASALVGSLSSSVEGSVNIASGRPVSLAEIARYIAGRLDAEDRLRLGALPTPDGDPPVLTACVERLSQEVKWKPSVSLEQGLDDAITWWKGCL